MVRESRIPVNREIFVKPYGKGRKAYIFQWDGLAWTYTGWNPPLMSTITLAPNQVIVYARKQGEAVKKAARVEPPTRYIPVNEANLVGVRSKRKRPPRPLKRKVVERRQKAKQEAKQKQREVWSGIDQGKF